MLKYAYKVIKRKNLLGSISIVLLIKAALNQIENQYLFISKLPPLISFHIFSSTSLHLFLMLNRLQLQGRFYKHFQFKLVKRRTQFSELFQIKKVKYFLIQILFFIILFFVSYNPSPADYEVDDENSLLCT